MAAPPFDFVYAANLVRDGLRCQAKRDGETRGKFVVTSGLRRRTFCSIVVSGAVIKLLQREVTSELRGAPLRASALERNVRTQTPPRAQRPPLEPRTRRAWPEARNAGLPVRPRTPLVRGARLFRTPSVALLDRSPPANKVPEP